MPMRWYGETFKAQLHDHLALRVEYAARTLRDYIRRKLLAHRSPPTSAAGGYPHYGTGHLARNVQMESDRSTATARVGTNVPYGKWLEFGTRGGRVIRPKRGKALRWIDAGGTPRFARQVVQGPIKPRPWLSLAVREMRPTIKRILEHRMASA